MQTKTETLLQAAGRLLPLNPDMFIAVMEDFSFYIDHDEYGHWWIWDGGDIRDNDGHGYLSREEAIQGLEGLLREEESIED